MAKEIAVERKAKVVEFLNFLSPIIFRFYNARQTSDQSKLSCHKVLDLTIFLQKDDSADRDPATWHLLLKNCLQLVEEEVNYWDRKMSGYQSFFKTSEIFIEFASNVVTAAVWDDSFLAHQSNGSTGLQSEKRVRLTGKMEYLIDHVQGLETTNNQKTISFRWLFIVAVVLKTNPKSITFDDYVALLDILVKHQQSIQNPDQQKAFYLTVEALICFEKTEEYMTNFSNHIEKLDNCWHTISEVVFRSTTVNNKLCKENTILLCLLIRYKKYKSDSLIQTIFDALFSYSMKQCDETMRMLSMLLMHFNMNSLKDAKEMIKKVFSFLFPGENMDARRLMSFDSKPNSHLIAKSTVLACLYKTKLKQETVDKWTAQLLEDNVRGLQDEETRE